MIFLKTIFNVVFIVICGGCIINKTSNDNLSDFPPTPIFKEYKTNPVIEYNKIDKNYTVTTDFMENAVLMKLYLNEINKWKLQNGVN